jgi:hypothetical protein
MGNQGHGHTIDFPHFQKKIAKKIKMETDQERLGRVNA